MVVRYIPHTAENYYHKTRDFCEIILFDENKKCLESRVTPGTIEGEFSIFDGCNTAYNLVIKEKE